MNTRKLGLLLGIGWMAWVAAGLNAAEFSAKLAEQEVPKEVGDSIKQILEPKAVQILEGATPIYQFWFRKEIPLKAKPESAAKSLSEVDEVSFLGVAAVGQGRRDYRDNEVPAGTYTVRFSLQPQDGDHLGTSEFPYFAVLIPAKSDTSPDALKTYKAMVKASGKATATGHPVVLALRPPSADPSSTPVVVLPAPENEAVRLSLPAKVSGGNEDAKLSFELVFQGKYKH